MRVFLLLTLFLLLADRSATAATTPIRPNVLFLFADDFTFDAIRALGDLDIETPHLDRLVRRGTTFTHAYNMGSWLGAVCVASRTMLVTGRSLWDARANYEKTDALREAGQLWPQLLGQQGYRTYFTGKWHIRTKPELAFDVVRNVRAGMPKDTPESYNRPPTGQPDRWNASDPSLGGFWEGGRHWSEVTADDAIDFIHDRDRGARPFFMYVAFNAPHDPRQSPQSYLERYPLERVALPKSYVAAYPYKDDIGCGPELRDERLAPFPRTEHAVKVHRREYFALISHLDAQIGRVFAALDAARQMDNTFIFFTADHGLAMGRHGLFGKQNMYEHSLRVPFVVAGPGVQPDRRVAGPIYLQDVMPTTLEIAGAAKPSHVFYQSLLPTLRGTTPAKRNTAVYGAYIDLQRAVIDDGYKLIVYPKNKVIRLYHLAADPHEERDLAGAPDQVATKRRLLERLFQLQQELGDDLDLRRDFGGH